jgi:hypothetical protein
MALTRAEITKRYQQRHPEKVVEWRKSRAERERGKLRPHLSDKEKQVIETLYQQGLSFKEIAGKIPPRTGNTIANYLRTKFEIRPRPVGRAEKSQSWKGGRTLDNQGYWYVRIYKDDPVWVMCGKRSTVAEHRLVMARLLGRPLLPTETVHHIDGVRTNNAPENLELRQGKHGKHVVFVCLDCGSKHIGPSPITEE